MPISILSAKNTLPQPLSSQLKLYSSLRAQPVCRPCTACSRSLKLEVKRPLLRTHQALNHTLPRTTVILSYNLTAGARCFQGWNIRYKLHVRISHSVPEFATKHSDAESSVSRVGHHQVWKRQCRLSWVLDNIWECFMDGESAHYIISSQEMICILNVYTYKKMEPRYATLLLKPFRASFLLCKTEIIILSSYHCHESNEITCTTLNTQCAVSDI